MRRSDVLLAAVLTCAWVGVVAYLAAVLLW